MTRRLPLRARLGFTLLELMVTIAVLGIGFGLVFLKLDHLVPSMRLKSNARELASVLEQARNHAIVSGRTVNVQYDLQDSEASHYRFYYPFRLSEDGKTVIGEGETAILDWESFSDNVRIRDVILGEGTPLTNGVITVVFDPRGIAPPHIVHLELVNSEQVYSVRINPLLGLVDIDEGYKYPEVLQKSAF